MFGSNANCLLTFGCNISSGNSQETSSLSVCLPGFEITGLRTVRTYVWCLNCLKSKACWDSNRWKGISSLYSSNIVRITEGKKLSCGFRKLRAGEPAFRTAPDVTGTRMISTALTRKQNSHLENSRLRDAGWTHKQQRDTGSVDSSFPIAWTSLRQVAKWGISVPWGINPAGTLASDNLKRVQKTSGLAETSWNSGTAKEVIGTSICASLFRSAACRSSLEQRWHPGLRNTIWTWHRTWNSSSIAYSWQSVGQFAVPPVPRPRPAVNRSSLEQGWL